MAHRSQEEWLRYINDQLADEQRRRYEEHLYHCEKCLQKYEQALETVQWSLPDPSALHVTEDIMRQISATRYRPVQKVERSLYQRTWFHYVLAAGMTIVLISSGMFESLFSIVENVQHTTLSEQSPSITEQLVERSMEWKND